MSQFPNNKTTLRPSTETEMEMVVSQAIQVANCQLVAIRETHGYLKRKAAEYGIILTEQDLHAWSVSAWLELAKAKAWLRMPATRFEKRSEKDQKTLETGLPPKRLLRRDSIDEAELIEIL